MVLNRKSTHLQNHFCLDYSFLCPTEFTSSHQCTQSHVLSCWWNCLIRHKEKRNNGAWNGSLMFCPLQPGCTGLFLEFTLFLLYHIPHCHLHLRIAAPSSFPTKVFAPSFHLALFIAILFFPIFQLVYFLTIVKVDAKTVSWFGLPSAEQWEKKSSLQTCTSDSYCCWQRQELQLNFKKI